LSVRLDVGTSPWIVSDELWDRLEPLLPQRARRFRYPGRKALPDREVLCGILYVLHTGIQWEYLPQELGFGSGMTCWRRLRDWNEAGVWQRLHEVLLAEQQVRDVARLVDEHLSDARQRCEQVSIGRRQPSERLVRGLEHLLRRARR
jgi:transposase